MRSKLFKIYMDEVNNPENWFRLLLVESKKRKYYVFFDKNNKMTDYSKEKKEINPITKKYEYFLLYDINELKTCNCKECQKKLKRMNL